MAHCRLAVLHTHDSIFRYALCRIGTSAASDGPVLLTWTRDASELDAVRQRAEDAAAAAAVSNAQTSRALEYNVQEASLSNRDPISASVVVASAASIAKVIDLPCDAISQIQAAREASTPSWTFQCAPWQFCDDMQDEDNCHLPEPIAFGITCRSTLAGCCRGYNWSWRCVHWKHAVWHMHRARPKALPAAGSRGCSHEMHSSWSPKWSSTCRQHRQLIVTLILDLVWIAGAKKSRCIWAVITGRSRPQPRPQSPKQGCHHRDAAGAQSL